MSDWVIKGYDCAEEFLLQILQADGTESSRASFEKAL